MSCPALDLRLFPGPQEMSAGETESVRAGGTESGGARRRLSVSQGVLGSSARAALLFCQTRIQASCLPLLPDFSFCMSLLGLEQSWLGFGPKEPAGQLHHGAGIRVMGGLLPDAPRPQNCSGGCSLCLQQSSDFVPVPSLLHVYSLSGQTSFLHQHMGVRSWTGSRPLSASQGLTCTGSWLRGSKEHAAR